LLTISDRVARRKFFKVFKISALSILPSQINVVCDESIYILSTVEVKIYLNEEIVTTAKAYLTDHSKVVVIPKKIRRKLGENNTSFFVVKLDDKGRIIYEPIKKETVK